jgi:hypothetical protein
MTAEDRTLEEDKDEGERVEHDESCHVDVRDADSSHHGTTGHRAGNFSYVDSTASLNDLYQIRQL